MQVLAVHAVRPEEISATEVIFQFLTMAEAYADALSTDPGVLAGGVTRFSVDEPGTRSAVALYVQGERQRLPFVSNDRSTFANGHGPARKVPPSR